MTFVLPALITALVLAAQPGSAKPAASQALGADQRARLDSGRAVVEVEEIPGSPWPRVTVKQFVVAAPGEAAAVFIEYERHAAYIPGLTRSVVSRVVSSRVVEVDYELDVPLFPNEGYTVRDSLSASPGEGTYRVDWAMVRARSTKAIAGHASFEPYRNAQTGEHGTLLTYVNFVKPGQRLAGPLRGRAIQQVQRTLDAVIREVERVRNSDPRLRDARMAALRAALGDSGRSHRP